MATVLPELKSLMSPDLPEGQEPAEPADAAALFDAEIGPKDLKGAEVFSFVAITPRALARDHGARWGRGYLILDTVSWSSVRSALQTLLLRCGAETWNGVATKLSREM